MQEAGLEPLTSCTRAWETSPCTTGPLFHLLISITKIKYIEKQHQLPEHARKFKPASGALPHIILFPVRRIRLNTFTYGQDSIAKTLSPSKMQQTRYKFHWRP